MSHPTEDGRRTDALGEVTRMANLMLGMVGQAIAYSSNGDLWDQLDDLLEVRKMLIKTINRAVAERVDPEAKPK